MPKAAFMTTALCTGTVAGYNPELEVMARKEEILLKDGKITSITTIQPKIQSYMLKSWILDFGNVDDCEGTASSSGRDDA